MWKKILEGRPPIDQMSEEEKEEVRRAMSEEVRHHQCCDMWIEIGIAHAILLGGEEVRTILFALHCAGLQNVKKVSDLIHQVIDQMGRVEYQIRESDRKTNPEISNRNERPHPTGTEPPSQAI